MLVHYAEIHVIGEAGSGEECIKIVTKDPPDLILMDIRMPGMGGIEATRQILRLHPQIKIIAVTVYSDDPFPTQLLDAGARGYVSKGCPAEEMLEAVHAVMSGKTYVSYDVARKLTLTNLPEQAKRGKLRRLSPREIQILLMIAQGHSTQYISDALYVSPKTVSTYRHRLYEKLDVQNDVELTRLALECGLTIE